MVGSRKPPEGHARKGAFSLSRSSRFSAIPSLPRMTVSLSPSGPSVPRCLCLATCIAGEGPDIFESCPGQSWSHMSRTLSSGMASHVRKTHAFRPGGCCRPLPNAPGSASCPRETMRASHSFPYPQTPRCRGPHIGVPAWRQDSTLTPCAADMPLHIDHSRLPPESRASRAPPGAFQISQAPAWGRPAAFPYDASATGDCCSHPRERAQMVVVLAWLSIPKTVAMPAVLAKLVPPLPMRGLPSLVASRALPCDERHRAALGGPAPAESAEPPRSMGSGHTV